MTNISRRQFVGSTLAASAAIALPGKSSAWTMSASMPVSFVPGAARWLLDHFGEPIRKAAANTPFSPALLCAIACQESGYVWYTRKMRSERSPTEILRLMVLDNTTPRGPFPRDTRAFLADRRVADIAPSLIEASDASRKARGIKPTGQLLYGYGLFQYDLQHIIADPQFWRGHPASGEGASGLWGDIDACCDRLIRELNAKYHAHPGDLDETVRAYNGNGANAVAYSKIVRGFERAIATQIT